jgi:hypothetical protein
MNDIDESDWSLPTATEISEDQDAKIAADELRKQLDSSATVLPCASTDNQIGNFTVSAKTLENLARVINVFRTSREKQAATVGIRVFGNRIEAVATRRSIVCRAIAPLEPDKVGAHVGAVCFTLPHWQLSALGKRFKGQLLRCQVDLSKQCLTIKSGKKAEYALTITSAEDRDLWSSEEFCATIACDPRELRKGLAHTLGVARKNKIQPEFGIVNIEDGKCRGGSPACLAVFESDALKDVKLGIAAEDIKTANSLLSRFQPSTTVLHQTQNGQVFDDGVVRLTLSRPSTSFPAIDKILRQMPTCSFWLPSFNFFNALSCVSNVSALDRNVTIHLEWRDDQDQLTLMTRSPIGFGTTAVSISSPSSEQELPADVGMTVELDPLKRAVDVGPRGIEVAIFAPTALMLIQEEDGRKSRTYIQARE